MTVLVTSGIKELGPYYSVEFSKTRNCANIIMIFHVNTAFCFADKSFIHTKFLFTSFTLQNHSSVFVSNVLQYVVQLSYLQMSHCCNFKNIFFNNFLLASTGQSQSEEVDQEVGMSSPTIAFNTENLTFHNLP